MLLLTLSPSSTGFMQGFFLNMAKPTKNKQLAPFPLPVDKFTFTCFSDVRCKAKTQETREKEIIKALDNGIAGDFYCEECLCSAVVLQPLGSR